MKYIAIVTAAALLCISTAQASDHNRYIIKGDFSAQYRSGDMVVWTPKPRAEGAAAPAGMMGAATMGGAGSADAALEKTLDVRTRAPLQDGRFVLEGEVDAPMIVHFYVLNAVSPDGRRYAPTKGQSFVLEPGEMTMTMDARGRYVLRGGSYNDAVYNSWKLSAAYVQARDDLQAALDTPPGAGEAAQKARSERISVAQSRMIDLEANGYRDTAMNHPQVAARILALQASWLKGGWELEALQRIDALAPGNDWVQAQMVKEREFLVRRERQRALGAVGTDVMDFTAATLDGRQVDLKDVRARSKYVLVEFWASWCGPCRAEIPHMKKAYERYRGKGFEIFSFTIDDSRTAWEKASREEQLPWIDTGMGSESEPKKLYGVSGVPANYLVDAASGKVVARDLRGYKLDEKLAELLD
jgi:thiol-disulfide isomerase/thioredoxin